METSKCLKLQKSLILSRLRKRISPLRLRPGSRSLSASTTIVKERLRNRHTSAPANQGTIVAFGELGVCDCGHRMIVRKEDKGSGLLLANDLRKSKQDFRRPA